MFSYFANHLTKKSNHLLDWSRIGELVATGSHRYSINEIIVRGSIAMFTATCSFMAAYLNDQTKTRYSSSTLAIAMGMIGFVVSHGIAIYPLYKKRVAMQAECNSCATEIKNAFCANPQDGISQAIERVIVAIMTLSLSNETRSNASQTWGHRLSLLHKLQLHLQSTTAYEMLKFYTRSDVSSVINDLDDVDQRALVPTINVKSR